MDYVKMTKMIDEMNTGDSFFVSAEALENGMGTTAQYLLRNYMVDRNVSYIYDAVECNFIFIKDMDAVKGMSVLE